MNLILYDFQIEKSAYWKAYENKLIEILHNRRFHPKNETFLNHFWIFIQGSWNVSILEVMKIIRKRKSQLTVKNNSKWKIE